MKSGQYFSPTNNFTQLRLTLTKNFYQLFLLLNKNQITEILKTLSDILYYNLAEQLWVGKDSCTDSSSEEVEDLHVDFNFDEPIDLALINFLFLK